MARGRRDVEGLARILSWIDRDAQANDLLAFLLVDVFANHLVGDRARADGQLSAGPEMPAPELLAQMGEFLQRHP